MSCSRLPCESKLIMETKKRALQIPVFKKKCRGLLVVLVTNLKLRLRRKRCNAELPARHVLRTRRHVLLDTATVRVRRERSTPDRKKCGKGHRRHVMLKITSETRGVATREGSSHSWFTQSTAPTHGASLLQRLGADVDVREDFREVLECHPELPVS
jgi:hypothetical protein